MPILREKELRVDKEDLTAQIDGVEVNFISANNFKSESMVVHLSGLQQREGVGLDYTITGSNQITFTKAPKSGMTLHVSYIVD